MPIKEAATAPRNDQTIMLDHNADLEEGEIHEVVVPHTPFYDCQISQCTSRSDASCATGYTGTTDYFGGSNISSNHYDSDDDSIKSSRPCTPPGFCLSKGVAPVPQTPGGASRTMPSRLTTNLESPTPQRANDSRIGSAYAETEFSSSSNIRNGKHKEEIKEPLACPSGCEIRPDVHEKAQVMLGRVVAMDRGRAGRESESWTCGRAGSQPVAEVQMDYHREPPKTPLSPEELERAIGIIEDLFVVNGVPLEVFIQSGVSPGTLYHAFKRIGLNLPPESFFSSAEGSSRGK